jgi:hypothetical protein
MSFLMVIMWTIGKRQRLIFERDSLLNKSIHYLLAGDVYKTTYFILRSAPIQFWLCGMLQVGLAADTK